MNEPLTPMEEDRLEKLSRVDSLTHEQKRELFTLCDKWERWNADKEFKRYKAENTF